MPSRSRAVRRWSRSSGVRWIGSSSSRPLSSTQRRSRNTSPPRSMARFRPRLSSIASLPEIRAERPSRRTSPRLLSRRRASGSSRMSSISTGSNTSSSRKRTTCSSSATSASFRCRWTTVSRGPCRPRSFRGPRIDAPTRGRAVTPLRRVRSRVRCSSARAVRWSPSTSASSRSPCSGQRCSKSLRPGSLRQRRGSQLTAR